MRNATTRIMGGGDWTGVLAWLSAAVVAGTIAKSYGFSDTPKWAGSTNGGAGTVEGNA